ncbi:MAG: response regulator [Syntrophobacteraceae bacterium]|nr:response regulator [Desulfobacteraceae bacterium]
MSSVLVVEVNDFFRKSFIEILKMHLPNLFVDGAGDGPEALKRIGISQPDMVLMDMRLNDKSGLELAKEIKKRNPEIVVGLFTSYDIPEKDKQSLRCSVDHFLLKDTLSVAEVARLIESVLSRKRRQQYALAAASN